MTAQKLRYLDPSLVVDRRQTEQPPIRSRTGYGAKLPSTWMLRIASVSGVRWHRVYIMCWSNCGTAYVIIDGERALLGSYDPGLDAHPVARSRSGFYTTTFCNRSHRLSDGRPIEHECYVLPVAALELERQGKYPEAIDAIEHAKPLRHMVRGVKEKSSGKTNQ